MSDLAPIKLDEKKLLGFRNVQDSKSTDAENNTGILPLKTMDRAFNKVSEIPVRTRPSTCRPLLLN